MTTIKAFTDLEQSKKLAEILPLESADMSYCAIHNIGQATNYCNIPIFVHAANKDIPCWSLAALLSVLPMIRKGEDTANPFIAKTPDNEYYVVYATLTKEVDSSAIYDDNPIDACIAMIEKLHELKML